MASFRFPARNIARDVERGFHKTQDSHRLRGEWFDLSPVEAIQILRQLIEIGLRLNTGLNEVEIGQALCAIGCAL